MNSMDPNLWELIKAGDGHDEVAAIVRLHEAGVYPDHIQVISDLGKIITCRLKREDIKKVRADARVVSLKAPEPVVPEQEIPAQLNGEDSFIPSMVPRRPDNLPETGRGVVIGVIDWGCDFANASFRKADGNTRLLALWDQSAQPDIHTDNYYGYGNIYSSEDINLALATSQPYDALGYHPAISDPHHNGSHGTHVLDIAAGNGQGGGPVGIAPEADLIFVHLVTRGTDGLSNLGDSVSLLEAVDFIAQTAGHRPWVINMSIGNIAGSHDGTTLVEQGLDEAIMAAPGRAICQSCGNYLSRNTHTARQVRPGEQSSLYWYTDKADTTPNELEIWYSSRDRFAVEITSPNGLQSTSVALGDQSAMMLDGQEICQIYHRAFDPNNHDHHINIFIYPGAPAGLWTVTITGEDVVDGRLHAWIERDEACRYCQSYFSQDQAVPFSTTGTICNGFRTIAVGAYNPHSETRELAHFSSMGPTRDGRQKPDLVAPGVDILAARSTPRDTSIDFQPLTYKSGTSMAAPHVTGTIALMFEAAKRPLTINETRRLLLTSTTPPAQPISTELATRVGSGYLNIEKAVATTRQFTKLEKGKDMAIKMQTEQEWGSSDNGMSEVSDYLMLPYIEEGDSSPLAGKYGVVIGNKDNSTKVRDELKKIAKYYTDQNDLRWSFPYVYSLVTNEVIKNYDQGVFKGGDAILHWVANFYELYVLNLQAFINTGKAESPWQTVFTESEKLLKDPRPWGARSAATFILGMFAHIKSDLPRALAYVFLKFYRNLPNTATGQSWSYDDLKPDFDIMNTTVFPNVINQVTKDGVVLPGITNVWPSFRDWYLEQRLPLTNERESAWKVGRAYSVDPAVIASVQTLSMRRSPTVVTLSSSVTSSAGKVGATVAQGMSSSISQILSSLKDTLKKSGEAFDTSDSLDPLSSTDCSCQKRNNLINSLQSINDNGVDVIDLNTNEIDIAQMVVDELENNDIENETENDAENETDESFDEASFDLVTLAEKLISSQGTLILENLLREAAAYLDLTVPIATNGKNILPSLTEIFNAFVHDKGSALYRYLRNYFEIVGYPGQTLKEQPQPGDLLIRRGEARLIHLAMIAAAKMWRREQLADVALLPEGVRRGWYMQIVDGGSHPHLRQHVFARLIINPDGRMPYDQILLRLKNVPSQKLLSEDDATRVGGDPFDNANVDLKDRYRGYYLSEQELSEANKFNANLMLDNARAYFIRAAQFFLKVPIVRPMKAGWDEILDGQPLLQWLSIAVASWQQQYLSNRENKLSVNATLQQKIKANGKLDDNTIMAMKSNGLLPNAAQWAEIDRQEAREIRNLEQSLKQRAAWAGNNESAIRQAIYDLAIAQVGKVYADFRVGVDSNGRDNLFDAKYGWERIARFYEVVFNHNKQKTPSYVRKYINGEPNPNVEGTEFEGIKRANRFSGDDKARDLAIATAKTALDAAEKARKKAVSSTEKEAADQALKDAQKALNDAKQHKGSWSWCAIFPMWAVRAITGNSIWAGGKPQDLTYIKIINNNLTVIKRGDILHIKDSPQNHHVILAKEVAPGDKNILTIEGNIEGQEVVLTRRRSVTDIDYFYSILPAINAVKTNNVASKDGSESLAEQSTSASQQPQPLSIPLILPDQAQTLETYLQRQLQPYKIPIWLKCGAIQVTRQNNDPQHKQTSTTVVKDPNFMVGPRDWITLKAGPACKVEFDNIPQSSYRDYAFAPVGNTFEQIFHEGYQLRPQTTILPPDIRSLSAFIRALTSVEKGPLPLITKAHPRNPIRNILLVSHAYVEGYIKIAMNDGEAPGITYEDLEKAKQKGTLLIPTDDLLPRPKDAAQNPLVEAFHIKGCRIGLALPFLRLLKEALGGEVKVTAPKHYSAVGRHNNPDGIMEYMVYGFRLKRAQPFKNQAEVIRGFINEKFTRIDGSSVPDKMWQQWIPKKIDQDSNDKETVISPVTNKPLTVERAYVYFTDDLYDKRSFIDLNSDPGTYENRKQAVKTQLSRLPIFSPSHPFPKYIRLGYKSMEEFMDGWTWNFTWDASSKQLSFTATRYVYTVRVPITDPTTNRMLVNFFPSGSKASFITQLNEDDTRLFATV